MVCDDIPVVRHKELVREAAQVGSKFGDIFLKFADTHFAINHARALTSDDLKRIGNYSSHSSLVCCMVCIQSQTMSN